MSCLLSSIFNSWSRNTYGFIFLGFEKSFPALLDSISHAARSLYLFSFYLHGLSQKQTFDLTGVVWVSLEFLLP